MPKKNSLTYSLPILIVFSVVLRAHSFCDIHFHSATPFFKEPRLERPWLSSFDIWLGGGKGSKSHDGHKSKVALFDLYGLHPMQGIGDGICKDFTDRLDNLIIKLSLLNSTPGFATFSIDGTCTIFEAGLRYTQNFEKGLFLECYLPIRSFKIHDIEFVDLSPVDSYPNNNDPYWVLFKKELPHFTAQHGLSIDEWKNHGIGDLALLAGWTLSHQDTKEIDFVDVTVQAGVTMPTGKKQDISYAFSLPFGYNKHWGIPLHGVCSIGAYEWLTVGISLDVLFLLAKSHEEFRMKSSPEQSSIILLNSGKAHVHPGTIWSVAPFFKADHVVRGFSLSIGYTYAHQKTTFVTPCNPSRFSYPVVNSDERFAGFISHTFHGVAEYDFTQQNWHYGPRVGITYNHQMSGKRCFKAYIASITGGLEVAWDF